MNYLSTTGKLSQFTQLIWVMSLAFFSCWFSLPAQGAWDWIYALPVNAQNYPRAQDGNSKFAFNAAYEIRQPVQLGQTLRVKVLIPPGTSSAKISAQSSSWQCAPDVTDGRGNIIVSQSERCPIMDGFDQNPGDFCPNNPTNANPFPCGGGSKVYPQDLHPVAGSLVDVLYPTEPNSPNVVTQPRYAYFVLYQQPQALGKFAFSNKLGISFGISNVALYNQWVDSGRPQFGGPIIDPNPTPTDPTPTDPPAILGKAITINPTPTNGTVIATTEPDGINCGNAGTDCSATYTTGSRVTLTAIPKEGFALTRWEGSCSSGTSNSYLMTMDVNKTCSALFNQQTTTFPEIDVGGPIIDPNPTPTNPTPTDPPAILGKAITINPTPTNGTVIATTEPDGINCGDAGTDCNAIYTTGSRVILTAIPKEGFALIRWEGSCSSGGTSNSYVMAMDSDKICSALFNKQTTTTFPEIEVFDGTTSIRDGATTPIEIGTHVGQPITKTFTVKNTGTYILKLTNITLPSGFSLIAGNLPGSIQPNSSANFTIILEAATEGAYSGTLEIANNDTDENPFNFVISGRVISERDINDGSLNGNLPFGNPDEFAGDAEIMVTVSVEDSAGFVEPLTRSDERLIEQGSFVDINATITPEPYHQVVEIVVVAALDVEEEMKWDKLSNWIWYQKISEAVWKPWPLNLSKLYIEPYGARSGQESYPINVFTGELTLESVKRLHLFVGYGLWVPNPSNPSQGGFSYLVSQPVTLEMTPVQVVPDDLIHRR